MKAKTNQTRPNLQNSVENRPTEDNTSGSEQTSKNSCPDCDGRIIAEESERFCEECGLVVSDEEIDHGPEWRSYDGDGESKSRVGAPLTESLHDRGLSTEIGGQNRDSAGNRLSANQRRKMARLRKWDRRFKTQDSQDRNLRKGCGEIQRMVSALGLPKNVSETASMLFRQAVHDDILPGRSVEGVAGAAVYIAARIEKVPRTYSQMEPVSRVDVDSVKSAELCLLHELELGIEPTMPGEYLPQFADALDLSQDHIRKAEDLLADLQETPAISGKRPSALAASALFAAGVILGEVISQDAVSKRCDTTPVTIRNQYRLLLAYSNETEFSSPEEIEGMRAIHLVKKFNGEDYVRLTPPETDNEATV
jgi:transcription initiation factor TFIIB